jgi:phosphate transport system permease protein
MNAASIFALVAGGALLSFWLGRRRALGAVDGRAIELHSLPGYYGWYAALWCGLPGLAVAAFWLVGSSWALEQITLGQLGELDAGRSEAQLALLLNDVEKAVAGNLAPDAVDAAVAAAAQHYATLRGRGLAAALGLAALLSLGGAFVALRAVRPDLAARVKVERVLHLGLMLCSMLAILVTIGIVLSLIFETLRFFQQVSPVEFLFGLHWSPQTALRADQVGSSGSFGAVPIFIGTLLITGIAMLVAVPIGLLSAVYMTFYASDRMRDIAKPMLEILAGVPTVVSASSPRWWSHPRFATSASRWGSPWRPRARSRRAS